MNKDEQTECLAKSFRLDGPSEPLKQQVLASARSVWSAPNGSRGRDDSLVPYFAALAATLLMILAVNALDNYGLRAQLSEYVVTIRPGETLHLDEETNGSLPYQHRRTLCIVGVSDVRYKTHFKKLQTLLSEGASL